MTYEEAKQAMASGLQVRRPEWAKDKFLEMVDGHYMFEGKEAWQPLNEDATSKTWEEVGGRKEATKAEKLYAAAATATAQNPTDATGGPEVQEAVKDAQKIAAQRLGEKQLQADKKQQEAAKASDEKAAKEKIEQAETPEQKKAVEEKVKEGKQKEASVAKDNEKVLSEAKKAEKDNESSDSSKNDSVA